MSSLRVTLLSSSLPLLCLFSAYVESTFNSSSKLYSLQAHLVFSTNRTKDDMASFTEAAITDGSHTNTVEDFFTSTQTRPLSNPQETRSPHEHIGPKADKGVSTVELGTTPKSRTALPSSVIINQTTADENFDGNTSAAGNILISPFLPSLVKTARPPL